MTNLEQLIMEISMGRLTLQQWAQIERLIEEEK